MNLVFRYLYAISKNCHFIAFICNSKCKYWKFNFSIDGALSKPLHDNIKKKVHVAG